MGSEMCIRDRDSISNHDEPGTLFMVILSITNEAKRVLNDSIENVALIDP